MIEVRVLRYFLAVAKEKSVSGAAKVLHISQPTLSRQLMDMEEELGKKLFIRGSRRITLTEEGMFLKKRAEEIIDLIDKTETEITSDDTIIGGDVYIGGGETEIMRIVAKTAAEIQKEYHNIHFHIYCVNSEAVIERLDKGLLDFGVLIEPADIQKYETLRLPATDTWGILMRKDVPLAEKEFIEAKDLYNLPLISSKQHNIKELLGKEAEQFNIVASYNLLFNASLMVSEGVGYAICIDKIIKTPEDGELCFRPFFPEITVHSDIVWKKHQIFSKAAKLFLNKLKENIK